jgi:NADH-quinone oxidoreductase subunit N
MCSLCIGFFIKLGVAPFHFWIPDVYEGSLIPVTLYFATVQKLVTFIIFLRLFLIVFSNLFYLIQPFFLICSFLSMLFGLFLCLSESDIKRFLAYSSINHMGFILLSCSLGGLKGITISLTYFFIYIILTFGAWLSIISVRICSENKMKSGRSIKVIEDLNLLIKNKTHMVN